MRGLLFGVLFVLIAATATVYFANSMPHQPWAADVCRIGMGICEHFNWLAAGTAVTAVLYLLARMIDR
jgi:hypothetical protein